MAKFSLQRTGLALAVAACAFSNATAQTPEPEQMEGLGDWTTDAVFTIGETFGGYTPPGIPDGMGAFDAGSTVKIVANHELRPTQGYEYMLANGTMLPGARVSSLVFDKESRELVSMGPAYHTIVNRAGEVVDDASDLDFGGLNRLCSAGYVPAGEAGFVDNVFLTGEETGGGTEFILDVDGEILYAAPWMGRAAWESAAALDVATINSTHVAVLIGDDRGDAALLLYVGEKQPGGDFLARNGLSNGRLYMWVADDGSLSPADWAGTGTMRGGHFVEVNNYDPSQAGSASDQDERGFDDLGFATQEELDAQKVEVGAFNFSRPEDVHTNPAPGKGGQVVFASTGRNTSLNQGADLWGTTYLVDVKINYGRIQTGNITADITILYDGDDGGAGQVADPDWGIRSPDNLVWADDGMVYIQEDRSIGGFGAISGEETSIWKLDPKTYAIERVAQMDRSAVPAGQLDLAPSDLGNWESSGIIDVTAVFGAEGERLLFLNTQAHSVNGGPIASEDLVQGGQFLFMSKPESGNNGRGRGRR
jgi:hypothetical protein